MKKNLLALSLMIAGTALVAQSPRVSLYEEFTGETCPPCASTNPGLNALLLSATNAPKIIAIKWQVPIPSAPTKTWSLYQTNKAEIDWRYRSTSAGGYGYPSQNTAASNITSGVNSAPSGRIDGQHQWVFGASSDHPVNMNNNVISTAQGIMSPFTINMQRAWNFNCSAVTLTITVTASQNFNAVGNLIFRTVMVEREINFDEQPGTNGEKKFEDVAIKSFPTLQAGTPMAANWTTNQSMTFTLNCAIPSYVRKKEEIALVGFIQDDGTRIVHQAARADKAPLPPDGLSTLAANVGVTCSNMITPKILIQNTGSTAITSIDVTPYVNNVAGTPITWTGNIPVATTDEITLPSIAAPATPGVYTFSYNVTAMSGPIFNIGGTSSAVSFVVVGTAQASPVAEGFVSGGFPPAGWANINRNQGTPWTRSTQTGGYFQAPMSCASYSFFNNKQIGDIDELILPPLDLGGGDELEMTFEWAYAQKNTSSNDKLELLASDDCGANWTPLWSKSGSQLATAAPQVTSFLPDPSDFSHWNTAFVNFAGFNKSSVLVKFVTTNDNGNNLYLDNINLMQKNPTGISSNKSAAVGVNVFPNPASGSANVVITSTQSGLAKITMMNTLGQVVSVKEASINSGSNTLSVDLKDVAPGVYNVTVEAQGVSVTKKLTVSK